MSTARVVATLVDPERSRIEARTESGNVVAMDAVPPDGDGSAAGPRETVLAALAGCTAMDVISILRKKRQRLDGYDVEVTAEAATDHPRVYTHVRVEHRIAGEVDAEAVRRAVELSATRYCPVSAMLSKSVVIEHHYALTGSDGSAREALVAVTGPQGARVVGG